MSAGASLQQFEPFDAAHLEAFATCFANRRDTYALQHDDGRYTRVHLPVDSEAIAQHLSGQRTIACYALGSTSRARWLCFDCDAADGLDQLTVIHHFLAELGLMSLQEASRRGGHLWMLSMEPQAGWELSSFGQATLAVLGARGGLRRMVEVYPPNVPAVSGKSAPKDAQAGVGCAVRAPFGIHRLSGRAYPFVDTSGRPCHPLRQPDALAWLVEQPRTEVDQLTAARARLRELLRAALAAAPERATSHADVTTERSETATVRKRRAALPVGRPDRAGVIGVIAWVNGHVDLPDLIAATDPVVALRHAGRGAIGWCPWHDDDAPQEDGRPGTPSLYVVHDQRYGWSWRCLSSNCGAHAGPMYDTFDWLIWRHGGSVSMAVAWARERYGLADSGRIGATTTEHGEKTIR